VAPWWGLNVLNRVNPLPIPTRRRTTTRRNKKLSVSPDFKRAALHFPVGVFTAWLGTVSPVTCGVFGAGFLVYEVMEDWRIKDRSYKDVLGYLVGIVVGSFLLWSGAL